MRCGFNVINLAFQQLVSSVKQKKRKNLKRHLWRRKPRKKRKRRRTRRKRRRKKRRKRRRRRKRTRISSRIYCIFACLYLFQSNTLHLAEYCLWKTFLHLINKIVYVHQLMASSDLHLWLFLYTEADLNPWNFSLSLPSAMKRAASSFNVTVEQSKRLQTKKTRHDDAVKDDYRQQHVNCARARLLLRLSERSVPLRLHGLEKEYNALYKLLSQTVEKGESNSCLLIGNRGTGKTALVQRALEDLDQQYNSNKSEQQFCVVRLNGQTESTDRLALSEIARQLFAKKQQQQQQEAGPQDKTFVSESINICTCFPTRPMCIDILCRIVWIPLVAFKVWRQDNVAGHLYFGRVWSVCAATQASATL